MEYKRSEHQEEYVHEITGVSLCGGRFVKNPQAHSITPADVINVLMSTTMILAIIVLMRSLVTFLRPSTYRIGVLFICLIVLAIFGLSIYRFFKRKKIVEGESSKLQGLELDLGGVTMISDENRNTVSWKDLKAIRVFQYSILFVPKDLTTLFMLIPVENYENVTAFLSENNIDIPVIK